MEQHLLDLFPWKVAHNLKELQFLEVLKNLDEKSNTIKAIRDAYQIFQNSNWHETVTFNFSISNNTSLILFLIVHKLKRFNASKNLELRDPTKVVQMPCRACYTEWYKFKFFGEILIGRAGWEMFLWIEKKNRHVFFVTMMKKVIRTRSRLPR